MSNLPPEHRNPSPDDEPAPEEMTGSFPAVDEEFMPPAPGPPLPPANEHGHPGEVVQAYPPAPEVNQYPPAPDDRQSDPTATGQFPAFGVQEDQHRSTAYFVDRNTGEQQILDDESIQQFEPPTPSQAVDQPVMYETSEVPQIGPKFPPEPANSGFESKNPTMQTGIEMPDIPAEPAQGPSTGVADAVELPPVPHPNIGVSPGDPTGPPTFDESDIDGYLDTEDIDADLPARVRKKLAKKAQPDSKFQQLKNERDSDSGWSYLAILGVLFVALIGFAWGCQQVSDADQSAARNAQLASEVNVTVRVGGDQVSISGALPDEETANELVALVAEHYDAEAGFIANDLAINPAISIDDSVLQITGQAQQGDTRPDELAAKLGAQFNVPVASNTVQYGALPENLVAVSVQVNGASVVVSGSVPDQTKLDLIKGAAESVWGADKADTSALVIGDVVWSGGRVSVTGDIPLGSSEPTQFAEQIRLEGIFVDAGTNDDDIATATPDELKAAIAQRFEVAPISFESGGPKLSAADEKTLDGIAELLLALPEEEKITIVGHSDNGGESAAARALAKQRASIAWAYLTQKRGVSDSADNEGSAVDSTSKITITFG